MCPVHYNTAWTATWVSRFKGAAIFRVVIFVVMIPCVLANNYLYFGRFDAYNFGVGSWATLKMEAEISSENRHTLKMEKEINSETLAHACQHDVFPKTAIYIRMSCATRYILSQLQDGQRTYYVTSERVRATIVAVEKLYVLHIVSVCL